MGVVRAEPGETVRILTRFDGHTGHFSWHCHILEHVDYEMMLHFVVAGDNDNGGKRPDPMIGNSPD
ncbi:multicopper oxidase domain-containing protein [Halomicrococcus sp. NG-SE-24]|uniref:multicopper oxidase domain-containing protein n=1 Tax=Halomicrococcus sp. NG-SE-24 TaxID=3436928 RepID=UPI003D986666